LGVGGGAYKNTFTSRFVLDKKNLRLKTAIFVRDRGDLACHHTQALVPVSVGDYICYFKGTRPADNLENPNIVEKCFKIASIDGNFLYLEDTTALPPIPVSVREGCDVYHNRDGSYFCKLPKRLAEELQDRR